MLKFITSFEDAKSDIRNFIMEKLQNTPKQLKKLETACEKSEYRNIDNYLDDAIYSDFRGLVIIDEARPELNKVLEKINANISVLEIKTYASEDNKYSYLVDTLYDENDEEVMSVKKERKSKYSTQEIYEMRKRRAKCDTIIIAAREEGFKKVFLGEDCWYAIRIGAAMKDKIKYIAAYQVSPVSAVTHIAEIQEIKPYKDTGKYLVVFKGPAKEIPEIPTKESKNSPQGSIYVEYEKLIKSEKLEDAL